MSAIDALVDWLARITTHPTQDVGTFDLKGIPAPARVFAPRLGS